MIWVALKIPQGLIVKARGLINGMSQSNEGGKDIEERATPMKNVILGLIMFFLLTSFFWIAPGYAQYYGRARQNSASLQAQANTPQNILIILDASDSMNDRIDGSSKIQMAKDVVLKTIRSLPPNVNVGLRVYGYRLGSMSGFFFGPFGGFASDDSACKQSKLMVPLGTNNRAAIASELLSVRAVGKTPITYSLKEAIENDFRGYPGQKTIILISDGRETCSYNPCDLAVDMVRSGVNVKVDTIGFGTHDKVADDQLRCIALSTKGKFYSVNTADELTKSLQDSTRVKTNVQAKIYENP